MERASQGDGGRMIARDGHTGLLRGDGDGEHRVTFLELFFDLVFVFAVTQLSHLLLSHLSVGEAARTALLLVAVWQVWIDTAWVTNWFDPDRPLVRLMLVGVMLASLLMAAVLPEAFTERGLAFAATYVAVQVGRTAFVVLALQDDARLRRNFQRILVWCLFSGVLWLAGGLAHGTVREALWLGAVVVDALAPAVGFVTPGWGRSSTTDWEISGEHLAERCQLFLLVALGESIVVMGSAFAGRGLSAGGLAAFLLAFLGSVASWWIYFDRTAGWGARAIGSATDPGRLGRSAYTYFHLPMVAGIIVTAVGDELVIAHPGRHGDTAHALVALGGPALFLAGYALFKRSIAGHLPAVYPVAIAVLVGLIPLGARLPVLTTHALATLALAAVAAWNFRVGRALGDAQSAQPHAERHQESGAGAAGRARGTAADAGD